MSATESGQWTEQICLDEGWADRPDNLADPSRPGLGGDHVPARPRMSPADEDDDYYDDDDDESEDDMDDYDDDDFDDDEDDDFDDDEDGGDFEEEDEY